jgi:hypothetical protein
LTPPWGQTTHSVQYARHFQRSANITKNGKNARVRLRYADTNETGKMVAAIANIWNFGKQPVFYEKTDKGYEMLGFVDYLIFPCRKID